MLYEAISESDPSVSKDITRSDEAEMSLVAEKRGNLLQQLNDNLQKDNTKLRAQFDEAVRIVQKIDEIHKKNISLSNELRDVKSEKEDLERRLQIALDINEELNTQIASQKAALHEQRQNDIASLQKEIKNSESQSKAINDDFNLKITQLEEEKEKIAIQLKIQLNIISRFIDSASHYFELTFDSPEKVISFLNQPPLKVNEAKTTFQVSNSATVKDETIDKSEKKNQRTLKKLNDANLQILALKTEISQSEKVWKTTEQSYKKKIQILKEKIQKINEENELNDEDNKHNILVLSQKVESLQNSLKSAKEEIQSIENSKQKKIEPKMIVKTAKKFNQIKNPQIDALEVEISTLKQKNEELNSINKKQEKKLNEFSETNQKLVTENDQLKKDFDKTFNDMSALNLIHESAMKELETLRSILRTKKTDVSEISKKKRKIADLKEKVTLLKEELKEKKKKDDDESIKFEEKIIADQNQIEKLKSENGQLHTQIFELTEKVKSLENDLSFSKSMSSNNNNQNDHQKPKSEPEIPIQIQTRQISQKFKKKLDTIEKEKEEIITKKEEKEKEFSDFMIKLSSVVLSKPFCVEDQKEILDSLIELKKSNDSLSQQNIVLSSIVKHIVDTFHFTETFDSAVLISDIDSFSLKFERKLNLLKKRKILINSIQKALSQKVEQIEEFEQKIKEFEENEKEMTNSLKKFETECNNLRRLVQSQESQIANFDEVVAKKEAANDQRHNENLMEWKQAESALRHTISEISMKNDQLQIENNSLVESNNELKNKIQDKKAKIVSLTLKMTELNKELNTHKNSIEKEFAIERSNYEETIKKLQQEAEVQRADTAKIAKELSSANTKIKKMKCDMKNAKDEQAHFISSLNEERNKLERDKQLIISNSKAQNLLVESEFASKLDERKSRWEREKKKIFSFVADQFSQFFNPIDVIDEMSFKNVVARVRDELIRMRNMDIEIRRLVGADCHQKTEDAVAQIVIGQPEMF